MINHGRFREAWLGISGNNRNETGRLRTTPAVDECFWNAKRVRRAAWNSAAAVQKFPDAYVSEKA